VCVREVPVLYQVSDTAVSTRAVIHLVQCQKAPTSIGILLVGTVLLDIVVSNSPAAESFLENPAVTELSIDIEGLCSSGTKYDTGYERYYRDFASRHRLGLLSWSVLPFGNLARRIRAPPSIPPLSSHQV